ncbi:HlyD family type I secretion periplasmic adaptor subunit [Bradyrhizobium sp. LHD-71]|uniref:HlyD family type I secretion periplasmic adaptor subunit n=1 Tax=Bradyrhizobium sp. LHD-71 TaxID=3072141 RepID=UPI00280D316E|nr:HlyD family type I secretion periplasmic adaptor subunit [Bradyrhizobium sp. LHD-71]MDQ8731415.1 HlyD family type I secretion periplasmic adaptor subunit [Bradyrhizobium sp. LHD-71]
MRAVNENRAGLPQIASGAPEARRLDPRRDIRRAAIAGVVTIVLLLGTVGLWAATAPIAGAVIASGKVVVESNVRRIQHPSGGVVAEIQVKDGDRVKAGDVLVKLDETQAKANLALIEIELRRFQARKARLEAERDGKAEIVIPPELAERLGERVAVQALEGEQTLFRTRRGAVEVQRSQLRERIAQSNEEIRGLAAQIEAKRAQAVLIHHELDGVQKLYEQSLVALPRLTALQREASRLAGEEGSLTSDTARVKGRIAEIELQVLQIDEDLRREVTTELRDVEGKIADLSERRIAAVDQLARVEMRAPQDGIVHQSTVHTIGGVIGPAEQIMLIVPETDGLVVEARIEPAMIDRLRVGQAVVLRFPAFDSATTPDLHGRLIQVSADSATDEKTGVSFYIARVRLERAEVQRLDGKALLPGMPVEVFIQTGIRTALVYLVKPLEDQLARSFRY